MPPVLVFSFSGDVLVDRNVACLSSLLPSTRKHLINKQISAAKDRVRKQMKCCNTCDVTLSVYPHRASLKNMPDHGGNRTYVVRHILPPWSGIFFKLTRCGYTLRVTSQASYSPEYITLTQKNQDVVIHLY